LLKKHVKIRAYEKIEKKKKKYMIRESQIKEGTQNSMFYKMCLGKRHSHLLITSVATGSGGRVNRILRIPAE